MMRESEEKRDALLARLEDLSARADRGEVAVGAFLSPREARQAAAYAKREGLPFAFFGGYDDAERVRVYALPAYMETEEDVPLPVLLRDYGDTDGIAALSIKGSGYVTLTHRSYLGSLLGLGIERDVLGDLVVLDENGHEAVLFCDAQIVPFLLGELHKVGSDTVRVREVAPETVVLPPRRMAPIHDTVASARLDAVVAALCNLSRERARVAVVSGLVEVEFECEERPDFVLRTPCILSVRGVGRFRVLDVSEQTKKGRLRLVAEKFL